MRNEKDRVKNIEATCCICGNAHLTNLRNIRLSPYRVCSPKCRGTLRQQLNPGVGVNNSRWADGANGYFARAFAYKKGDTTSKVIRDAARVAAYKAVQEGWLKKLPCKICGELKVQAHHTDYSKPFEVTWLCRKHHDDQHRTKNEVVS